MKNESLNIVVCGNYGATNLGDEAILDGILAIIKRAVPDAKVTVLSSNPSETSQSHDTESAHLVPSGVRSFFRGIFGRTISKTLDAIKNSDLFILGGGGLFTDEKFMAPVIWSLQARIAEFYGVPIFCFGQSVGPLRTFFGKNMASRIFKIACASTVRDEASFSLLSKFGINNVVQLADPAFALGSVEPISEVVEPYVVISVRPWIKGDVDKNYTTLARFINWLWEEHELKSVLVPFQIVKDDDFAQLEKIRDFAVASAGDNGCEPEIFSYTSNYRKVMELMSRGTAVVGMRLHSLIFSTLVNTPFLALSYSDKVAQFAKEIEMSDYVVDWSNLEFKGLVAKFESLLENRDDLVTKLSGGTLKLRSKALEHEKILKETIESLQLQ